MTTDSSEVSIYKGELTKKCLIDQIDKLKKAFPKVPPNYFEVLKDRFLDNEFCDERATASVNNVIDTYEGWDKFPNIANFIQYDRKIKHYTYNELKIKHKDSYYHGATYDPIASEYTKVDFNGERRWVNKDEAERFNLPKWTGK